MLIPLMRGFYQLHGKIFFTTLEGGFPCALDPWMSPFMILYFTRDLVDDLNSEGSFFRDFCSVKECS